MNGSTIATSAEMLDYLRERLGGPRQLSEAISNYRASQGYKGTGATIMDAATELYKQEKQKQIAEDEHEQQRAAAIDESKPA